MALNAELKKKLITSNNKNKALNAQTELTALNARSIALNARNVALNTKKVAMNVRS